MIKESIYVKKGARWYGYDVPIPKEGVVVRSATTGAADSMRMELSHALQGV